MGHIFVLHPSLENLTTDMPKSIIILSSGTLPDDAHEKKSMSYLADWPHTVLVQCVDAVSPKYNCMCTNVIVMDID